MSRSTFLARFGDAKHIDEHFGEVDSRSGMDNLVKNPELQPRHIKRIFDEDWVNHKVNAVSHPSASVENLDQAMNDVKDHDGSYGMGSRSMIHAVLTHKNALPRHLDDVYVNAHPRVVADSSITWNDHASPEYLEKASTHPDRYVRYAVSLHKNTPKHTLEKLKDDSDHQVVHAATIRLHRKEYKE